MTITALLAIVFGGVLAWQGRAAAPGERISDMQAIGFLFLFGGIGTLLFHGF